LINYLINNILTGSGKIFFASDFHLGLQTGTHPLEREKKVVKWLNSISGDAKEIYLLGDIFDFWWEYKKVVPRGFTRFLGTISSITDSGIPVHFFTGNHDMWVGDYLTTECGLTIHTEPVTKTIDGKRFHLAHGEGLGSDDKGYKILLSIFRNKPLRVMYSAMHPSIGMGIGHSWSLNSRLGKGITKEYLGEDKEDLIKYAKGILKREEIDYFIFGHRHLAKTIQLNDKSTVIILGDWIKHGSYVAWDGNSLELIPFG
jgi:UDP-2,3-diacylglucosamine hydrolase